MDSRGNKERRQYQLDKLKQGVRDTVVEVGFEAPGIVGFALLMGLLVFGCLHLF